MPRARRLCGMALAAAAFSVLAGAQGVHAEPSEWLSRMGEAVQTLNYEGTFVHMHAGEVETLYIIHRHADGRSSERLVSMDGAGREIIRHEDEVTCILPDRGLVLVEHRRDRNPLQAALPAYSEEVADYYEFSIGGVERVAGRSARVLTIAPRDDYRYGFRLWLDEASAMPLKTQMRDTDGNIVEQLLFTNIRLPESIPESALDATTSTEGFTWLRREREPGDVRVAWRAGNLPGGFQLKASTVSRIDGAPHVVQQLVYSDGLAAVSVFVEEGGGESEAEWPLGLARMGGANAYSLRISGRMITAVGEVPALTVRTIAESLEENGEADDR